MWRSWAIDNINTDAKDHAYYSRIVMRQIGHRLDVLPLSSCQLTICLTDTRQRAAPKALHNVKSRL